MLNPLLLKCLLTIPVAGAALAGVAFIQPAIATQHAAQRTATPTAFAPRARDVHDAIAHADAFARDTVILTGTVRDGTTKLPVSGAQVLIGAGASYAGSTTTDIRGCFTLAISHAVRGTAITLAARRPGYEPASQPVRFSADTVRVDFTLTPARVVASDAAAEVRKTKSAPPMTTSATPPAPRRELAFSTAPVPFVSGTGVAGGRARGVAPAQAKRSTSAMRDTPNAAPGAQPDWNREQYDRIEDNPFLAVAGNPRSTFSIDVDRASYGNVRRFLADGQKPPADAVRIEELVNYFPYTLEQPRGNDPIAITTEVASAPWQAQHKLVRIALQARRINADALPPNNLVFLIDVSGSMESPDKLPLVKESLRLLVNQLRDQDRVALVVYAGNAGLVLPSTEGSEKARIAAAIDKLEAGGSTAGGAGLELAYRVAREHFIRNGNNRVILATDGDFNVGPSSDGEMERLIEAKRSEGTYLTVLGFGRGNIQDAKMEKLAKKGNGNYAYVDNIDEARKTLVREMGATLVTVANDVKLQVEFNPAAVRAFRLIGYEDRLLRDEDFNDDRKDAGDIGSGHTVTALYEVVPMGVTGTVNVRGSDSLRYATPPKSESRGAGNELLFVKLRYKQPGDSTSKLMTHAVTLRGNVATSDDFRFAASVASFGMLLRNSEYKGNATGASVLQMARGALGQDDGGYRAEFVRMVERWQDVSRGIATRDDRRN